MVYSIQSNWVFILPSLYMKKMKALSMLLPQDASPATPHLDVNTLNICIKQASGLKSTSTNRLPSTYFVYQFFDLREYISAVKLASTNPVFDDQHSITVRMTPELDLYVAIWCYFRKLSYRVKASIDFELIC